MTLSPVSSVMQWYAVPCEGERLTDATVNESVDGKTLGAWLLDLDGPRMLAVCLGGIDRTLKIGLPHGPFSLESTRPTRAPAVLTRELHMAFGWELQPSAPPRDAAYCVAVTPLAEGLPVRMRDPVLRRFRKVQGSLASRGVSVGLRVDLSWDCCSAELAEEARQAMGLAMRRRRPREEVRQLFELWVDVVQLRVAMNLVADVDPGRLIETRLTRALSHDVHLQLTTRDAAPASRAAPDLLSGLLSLCSLAEASDPEIVDMASMVKRARLRKRMGA